MVMDVRAQACSYLGAGRVRIFNAQPGGDDDTPLAVRAYVDGQSRRYFVRHLYDGSWLCSCETGGGCPHIAAVQLVTGYGGPASPRTAGEGR